MNRLACSMLVALPALAATPSLAAKTPPVPAAIAAAVAAPSRTPANRARDRYRHPAQTLVFFGVKPTDTVVEIWPAGGWYTEILAPLAAARGKYYAAGPWEKGLNGVRAMQARDPATYGKVTLTAFPATADAPGVPDGSADVVLTFRNVHNWYIGGADRARDTFAAMFRMLKPGGTLGVVEHRLSEARDSAAQDKSGYIKTSTVITLATAAGFKLAARSEVNANPKDTADWPQGVWTLPPSYALKQVDRETYAAIGESDRMTLKFVKPR